jgi:hypothetical protein
LTSVKPWRKRLPRFQLDIFAAALHNAVFEWHYARQAGAKREMNKAISHG